MHLKCISQSSISQKTPGSAKKILSNKNLTKNKKFQDNKYTQLIADLVENSQVVYDKFSKEEIGFFKDMAY